MTLFIYNTSLYAKAKVLVRGNYNEPLTLDPSLADDIPSGNITRDLFEPLMSKDKEGNLILGQAKSYTISEDKLVYTFKIRKKAKWSDGTCVTAYDFEYAFKRCIIKNNNICSLHIINILNASDIKQKLKPIETLGVKVIDNKTFKITLERPTANFLDILSHISTSPIPRKAIEKYETLWTQPENIINNGAYTLQEWRINKKIVLDKNENYYNKDKIQIQKVTFIPNLKTSTELLTYLAGNIDITYKLPINQYKELINIIPNEIKTFKTLGVYYYNLNMKRKPFNDIRVRKALSYAINRELLIKRELGTGEPPMYAFVPNIISKYKAPIPQYQTWTQKQREIKAQELLSSAGITPTNPLKFELLYDDNEQNERTSLYIIYMWEKVFKGAIIVTPKSATSKTYMQAKMTGDYQVCQASWIGDYNEDSTILDLLTKNHKYNNSYYDNPKYDMLLKKIRDTLDYIKRNTMYQKLNLMITQDMPVIPIYQYNITRLVKPYIGGYPKTNPLDIIYTKYLYIKEKKY